MKKLNISEARSTLSALVESVSSTHVPVVLLRYGKPAAMLVPVADAVSSTHPYPLRGMQITVSEDFDTPLSNLWEAFETAGESGEYRSEGKRVVKPSHKGKQA